MGETTGRCCGSLRIHERHKGEGDFVCLPVHVNSCICQLACELCTCWLSVWQKDFVFLADGCLPPCFCTCVFLRACLWELNNKIWALLGQSLWKLTLAVKSVRVPTVTILRGITAHNLGMGGWGWFVKLPHLVCNFIPGFLAALNLFGIVWLVCLVHAKDWEMQEREKQKKNSSSLWAIVVMFLQTCEVKFRCKWDGRSWTETESLTKIGLKGQRNELAIKLWLSELRVKNASTFWNKFVFKSSKTLFQLH